MTPTERRRVIESIAGRIVKRYREMRTATRRLPRRVRVATLYCRCKSDRHSPCICRYLERISKAA